MRHDQTLHRKASLADPICILYIDTYTTIPDPASFHYNINPKYSAALPFLRNILK